MVLKVTEPQPQFGRVMVADYLPAGFEIDNPHLVSSGDTGTLAWIADAADPVNSEFRDDRFTAAFDRKEDSPPVFTVAYVVRAVSPGHLRAAAGTRRGHVPAGSLRPHRDRHGRDHGGKMRRWRNILAGFAGAAALAALALGVFVVSLGPAPTGGDLEYSQVVLDRNGRLLRAYATPEGRWRLPAAEQDVDPRFLKLLFAYEDKRFRSHHGVDPQAMLRAAFQFASTGHIVSGGSTLTMQVARLLEPREHRNVAAKLRQVVRALELERHLSKTQMLALYLSLAPYGGNLEGIRAASLAYFGKEPRKLTLGEAALLVALPQSPELRRPDRFPERAQAARDRVLDRAAEAGAVPRDEVARAKAEAVPRERKPLPVLAPHAADQVVGAEPGAAFASPDHRRRFAAHAGRTCARARPRAGAANLRRHPRRRQRNAAR